MSKNQQKKKRKSKGWERMENADDWREWRKKDRGKLRVKRDREKMGGKLRGDLNELFPP